MSNTSTSAMIAERLGTIFSRDMPGVRVTDPIRLSGGASQETWSFDVTGDAVSLPLILRRSPGGATAKREVAAGLDVEAAVIAVAQASGVPVAPVVHVLSAADGLGPGFVSKRIDGETLGHRLVHSPEYADCRTHLAADLGSILARIHTVPTAGLDLVTKHPAGLVADAGRQYRAFGTPRPVIDFALAWLSERVPQAANMGLVHGDFRVGNFIAGPEGPRAVLDWEGVHIGDPVEDLGWMCVNSWRFGRIDRPAGGIGSREELLAGYARVAGWQPALDHVRWWEVYGSLRWCLGCATMAAEFAAGDRSVERAAIGRRASETELDILRLIAPRNR
jgi:aminoglycoside phosphotransferase (APT) family kinase protein